MTALELMTQLQKLCLTSGAQTPVELVLLDSDTQQDRRHEFAVETRIGPGGVVYFALVPVVALVRG